MCCERAEMYEVPRVLPLCARKVNFDSTNPSRCSPSRVPYRNVSVGIGYTWKIQRFFVVVQRLYHNLIVLRWLQSVILWPCIASSAGSSLTELRLDSCRVSEAALQCIGTSCPQLSTLSMVACRGVTNAGLQHLMAACTRCYTLYPHIWAHL